MSRSTSRGGWCFRNISAATRTSPRTSSSPASTAALKFGTRRRGKATRRRRRRIPMTSPNAWANSAYKRMESLHVPVLLQQTIEGLDLHPGDNVVDCTVGAGGHAAAILERTAPDGRLLGLDVDEAALDAARRNLDAFGSRAMLVRESYRDVGRVLPGQAFGPVHAALLDLGFSSMEIDD